MGEEEDMMDLEATKTLGGARGVPNEADCKKDPSNQVHVPRGRVNPEGEVKRAWESGKLESSAYRDSERTSRVAPGLVQSVLFVRKRCRKPLSDNCLRSDAMGLTCYPPHWERTCDVVLIPWWMVTAYLYISMSC